MKVILLYWFAAQQKTSTFRRQKIGLFYLEYSVDFSEFAQCLKIRGRHQKCLKLKMPGKTRMCVFRRLRVKVHDMIHEI